MIRAAMKPASASSHFFQGMAAHAEAHLTSKQTLELQARILATMKQYEEELHPTKYLAAFTSMHVVSVPDDEFDEIVTTYDVPPDKVGFVIAKASVVESIQPQ
jgi:hypothetical protein